MSQEFKTIAIVEDDDYFYRQMLPFLMPLEIEILRADNRNDTMKLIGELSEEVFWIVDGNFPKFNGEGVHTLGPSVVNIIREYKKGDGGIIGFTSDPTIFKGTHIPVFDKRFFTSSMGKIVELILKTQKSSS